MNSIINYDSLTEDDNEKIRKALSGFPNQADLTVSLVAAHLGNKLDLDRLLEESEIERTCDIYSIHRKVDLETGLMGYFVPKCGFRRR